jgi:glycosyltransferase involved in cell wall biosynthesis
LKMVLFPPPAPLSPLRKSFEMLTGQPEGRPPRVSVLMAAYNSECFLGQSVESILGQTFADFEFIVIDDGSTDSTPQRLAEYAARDTRIRLEKNAENIGLTRSLNRGLALARGEYLARQDADDISLPQRLERQVDFLDRNPGTGLVGCALEIIDSQGARIGLRRPPENHESIIAEMLLKNNGVGHSAVMARLALLRELGGYDERIACGQDYDLWWRLSRRAGLANLAEPLVRWRDTPGSISRTRREKQLEHVFGTSLGIVRESLGGESLDEAAYRRFWRAYHGAVRELAEGDIVRLGPLWDLLASRAGNLSATVEGLQNLACALVRERRLKEANQILSIIHRKLERGIPWVRLARSLARACLPAGRG